MATAEDDRLQEVASGAADWRRWGTYLSERAWGTVREDYSADGDAWAYFPFEQARTHAYRWNEDGLAGWCDTEQTIVMALSLWNGQDAILKERPFGLSNGQGNHGEDVKDYWFYTDNLPTHAYASMVYKYPQVAFPYDDLIATNASRSQELGEYELFDALEQQWRDNRYFDVVVEYAKATPEDVFCRITVTNRGPDPAPIHVLPHLWYRNTWTWDSTVQRPRITLSRPGVATTHHPKLGDRWFTVTSDVDATPRMVFCENETNNELLYGSPNASATTKDGIDSYVVHGDSAAVDTSEGSKVAAIVSTTLAPGASATIDVRLSPVDQALPFAEAAQVIETRRREADDFYESIANPSLSADERLVQRQALAGLLWCKQYYHYEVRRWLQGDPTQPTPPEERWTSRNSDWQHFVFDDVILMPDAWEYPWFAAWDLAFHCVTMAMIDPDFAKQQVLILLSSMTQHPHGQIPAYEWNFGDTNPPVHAWAAWNVYQLDRHRTGHGDLNFLAEVYRSVTLDVMWWLNQKDDDDRGVFGGGFLGMDNIGVFDRDQPLPTGGILDQVDGTSWMAAVVLQLLEMNVELAGNDPSYNRMFGRWVWDAWLIANALEKGAGHVSFWNEDTGFYHDVIEFPDGSAQSLEVFSMQAIVPLFASVSIPVTHSQAIKTIAQQMSELRRAYHQPATAVNMRLTGGDGSHLMVAVVDHDRLHDILKRVLDPDQFLSDHGVRSLSKYHQDHPYVYQVHGTSYEVDYMPSESHNRMFGGNSNWRGPIWMPMNFLLIQSLYAYARFYGEDFAIADPTGSSQELPLAQVCHDLARRLSGIFVRDDSGRRAVFGDNDYFQNDPNWRDLVPFYEYFDGDTGRGLGASHQTGWTAAVALLLQYGGNLRFDDDMRS